jgi:hypothetical protein
MTSQALKAHYKIIYALIHIDEDMSVDGAYKNKREPLSE